MDIIVYSKENCDRCAALKSFLEIEKINDEDGN